MAKAWAEAAISSSAARTIGRGVRAGHEDVYSDIEPTLVDYAASRDLHGLDAMIRHYQTRADALDGTEPSDLNGVHLSQVGNRWALTGDFDHLSGMTVDEALLGATDEPADDDPRPPAKKRADALTRICRFYLDHADLRTEGGERPHINIGINWETIRGDLLAAGPMDTPLSPADINQLLCDYHHRRIHKPGWTATFDGLTFTVTNPDGRVIGPGSPADTPSIGTRQDLGSSAFRWPARERSPWPGSRPVALQRACTPADWWGR
jgi:hypothetical protein